MLVIFDPAAGRFGDVKITGDNLAFAAKSN
jgi:hypothetical protein